MIHCIEGSVSAASDEGAFADAIKTYVDANTEETITDADTTNVSVTFPGGFILKCGYEDGGATSRNVSYATPFPNAVYAVGISEWEQSGTSGGTSNPRAIIVGGSAPGLTGMTISLDDAGAGAPDRVYWWAFGK